MKVIKYAFSILLIITTGALLAQPVNNDCSTAISVGIGVHDFTTIGATTDGPEQPGLSCYSFGNDFCNQEVWYAVTAENDGSIEFSTCSTIDYDSRIAVYDDGFSCPPAPEDLIACNDDGPGCSNFSSLISFEVEAGETYLICIGGYDTDETGSGTFSLTEIATPTPPDNNLCPFSFEAVVVTPDEAAMGNGWNQGNNEYAPTELGGPSCLPTGEFFDVWYHFDSGDEDLITVKFESITDGAEFHVELWQDDCVTAELDTDNGGIFSQVCFNQNETNDGLLPISGFSLAPGSYRLRVITQITNFLPGAFQFQLVAGVPLGISEIQLNEDDILLYPNPNNGQFTIDSKFNITDGKAMIYNQIGSLVFSANINLLDNQKLNLNLQHLDAGLYFVQFLSDDNSLLLSKKMVIK